MRRAYVVALAGALILMVTGSVGMSATPKKVEDTSLERNAKKFEDLDPKNFTSSTKIDNEWWSLKPGSQFIYDGSTLGDNDERIAHRLIVTVTDLTKVIGGVRSVVLYEEDIRDGQMAECELAFFAQDDEGAVWHMGEYSEVYNDGEFVGGRAFMEGQPSGARAGIEMPGKPKVGTPSYSQGYGPPPYNWTDRGRIYQMGQKTKNAMASYDEVLVTEEFNAEEPGAIQLKYYARGVGYVRVGAKGADLDGETLELTKLSQLDAKEMAKIRETAMALETRAYVYGTTQPAEQTPPAN